MFRSISFQIVRALVHVAVVSVVMLGVSIGIGHTEEFLSVLDDMPLAPGLIELTDQAADFETPAGRIIDAAAQGEAGSATVSAFYDTTLSALGWVREGQGLFVRDHESLTIAIAPAARKGWITARFSLRPRDNR